MRPNRDLYLLTLIGCSGAVVLIDSQTLGGSLLAFDQLQVSVKGQKTAADSIWSDRKNNKVSAQWTQLRRGGKP